MLWIVIKNWSNGCSKYQEGWTWHTCHATRGRPALPTPAFLFSICASWLLRRVYFIVQRCYLLVFIDRKISPSWLQKLTRHFTLRALLLATPCIIFDGCCTHEKLQLSRYNQLHRCTHMWPFAQGICMVTSAAVITFAFVLSHFFASRSEIYVHEIRHPALEKLKHCSNDFCCNSFIKSGNN